MGKDAISQNDSTEKTPTGNVDSSPLIFIILAFAIVGLVIYFFKDVIFKKKTLSKSSELPEPKPELPLEPIQPETVKEPEATIINSKFADLNENEN